MSKYVLPSNPPFIANCYLPDTAQTGQVYYNSGTQSLNVFDGCTWIDLGDFSNTLTFDAEEAIDKMIEITRKTNLNELADKYPLIAETLGQLEVALKLCQNNEPNKL